jgi:nitroreductase
MPQHTVFAPPAGTPGAFAAARAEALEHAADLARLAPSVHNTQPWTLVLGDGHLALRADRSRQLSALDPLGRELVLSAGAALFNARVALSARGWAVQVQRQPDPDDPDLLAEVWPVAGRPDGELAALEPQVSLRHTNRRRFGPEPVPAALRRRLTAVVTAEDVQLIDVFTDRQRRLVARLTQEADRLQNASAAYRAELRHWTSRSPGDGDGVPASAIPHVDGRQNDQVPIRDFDTRGTGGLPPETASDADQTLVLLATAADDVEHWLRAGEAMERLLLELTALDWQASPLTQPLEDPLTRSHLQFGLSEGAYPQMLLRIGRAAPTTATPRRRREDVVRNSTRAAASPHSHSHDGPPERPADARPAQHPVSDGRGGTAWR